MARIEGKIVLSVREYVGKMSKYNKHLASGDLDAIIVTHHNIGLVEIRRYAGTANEVQDLINVKRKLSHNKGNGKCA